MPSDDLAQGRQGADGIGGIRDQRRSLEANIDVCCAPEVAHIARAKHVDALPAKAVLDELPVNATILERALTYEEHEDGVASKHWLTWRPDGKARGHSSHLLGQVAQAHLSNITGSANAHLRRE